MNSLIARLAAATGPDRFIDAAIADHFGWRPHRLGYMQRPDWWEKLEPFEGLPFFTRSITTAVALVERQLPDHRWLIDRRPFADTRPDGYRATVFRQAHNYRSDGEDTPQAWAATPAIALLKAMFIAVDAKAARAAALEIGSEPR